MATKIARLLKTEMTDLPLPALAQLVRAGGRGKDTILAHITPEEAQVLKDRGGSGKTNPNTGLPEYQMDFGGEFASDFASFNAPSVDYGSYSAPSAAPADAGYFTPDYSGQRYDIQPSQQAAAYGAPSFSDQAYYAPVAGAAPFDATPAGAAQTYAEPWSRQYPAEAQAAYTMGPEYAGQTTPEPGSAYERVKEFITRNRDWLPSALKLGGGALGAIPAMGQIGRARRGAAKATAQQQQLGYPYQVAGQQMVSSAQRGELTPERQQAFQAAQAQLAQQQAQTGFVGSQAFATQLQAFRNQLLQNQYDYGLKTMAIGDQYVKAGLQAGLNADQQVQQSINNFYGSLGKIVGGVAV
jgi:hypothetical protein